MFSSGWPPKLSLLLLVKSYSVFIYYYLRSFYTTDRELSLGQKRDLWREKVEEGVYLPFWPTVDVAAARVNPLLIGFTSGDQVDWPDFNNREVGATGGLINSFRATLIGLRPVSVTTVNRESGSALTDTSAASSASSASQERIGRVPSRGTASIQPQSVLRSSSSTTERPALLNTVSHRVLRGLLRVVYQPNLQEEVLGFIGRQVWRLIQGQLCL